MDMTDLKLLNRALKKCKYNKALLGRTLGIKNRSFIHNILAGGRPLPESAELLLNEFMENENAKSNNAPPKSF